MLPEVILVIVLFSTFINLAALAGLFIWVVHCIRDIEDRMVNFNRIIANHMTYEDAHSEEHIERTKSRLGLSCDYRKFYV